MIKKGLNTVEGILKLSIDETPTNYGMVVVINASSLDEKIKVLNGDSVIVTIDNVTKITKIIKRSDTTIPGVLFVSSKVILGLTKKNVPMKRFKPIGYPYRKLYPDFIIPTKKNVQSNDIYCTIKINCWNNTKFPIGSLQQIIGNVGEFKAEQEFLKYRNSIKYKKIRGLDKNYNIDITPTRKNFTHLTTFSIDPRGCEDIDDAISIELNDSKTTTIYIHIADVSSFIPEDSILDNYLKERISSVYLHENQINLLPDNFATNICSLKKNEQRRAFTAIITIDKISYKIVKTEFTKSLIKNNYKLTYEEADEILKGKDCLLKKNILSAYNIGQKLFALANENINMALYDSHKMVEIFMILTNHAVGSYFKKHCPNNGIFRIHKQHDYNIIQPSTDHANCKNMLKAIEISNILRMNRAIYSIGKSSENMYHYGLNINYYTHFTSPIRRYADILVHRLLYKLLSNEDITIQENIKNTNLINIINKVQVNIKRAQRESSRLAMIYDIYNNYNSTLETHGYIIYINDNTIGLYIPDLNTEIEPKFFSNKLKKIINYTSSNESLVLTSENNKLKISMFDKVIIKIVISLKTYNFKKKIIVQFLDPDPLSILKL
jgi:exoribonuclease R